MDQPAVRAALTEQEWDIALALHEQARLRAERAELPETRPGTLTAVVLDRQARAAQLAEDSLASRITALERYAAEVREADAAYRDRQQAEALAELNRQHLDLQARAAVDEHSVAEIEAMSQHAPRDPSRAPRIAQLVPREAT